MELMLLKWKDSCVSDTYGFELWVRTYMRKNFFIVLWTRISL